MTTPTIVTPEDDNTTANSFVSLEEADIYFAGRFGGSAWEELDTDAKTRLLITATNRLDAESWGGQKVQGGMLSWFRSGVIDSEGYAISSTTVPKNLKFATCEQAFYYIKEGDITLVEGQSLELFENIKIGSIDLTTKDGVTNLLAQETRNQLKKLGSGVWLGEATPGAAKTYNMYR